MRVPPTVIAIVDASGSARQIQAAGAITAGSRLSSMSRAARISLRELQPNWARSASSSECPELVDIELDVAPPHGADQAEADGDLRGGARHHGDRRHLAVLVPEPPPA